MMKYIIGGIFVVIGLLWALMWAGVIPGLNVTEQVTIKKGEILVWSTVDDQNVFKQFTEAFKVSSPGVKVIFEKKSTQTYEQELLRAFAAGKGPDLFSIHHTWLLRYGDILAPAPATVFSAADVKKSYVDVVARDFVAANAVYGVPLYVDTLALYYNTDLFNSAGIVVPPADWDEFVKDSRLLTKRKSTGDIFISGAALGGSRNIPEAADILALLMLQYGSSITDASGKSVLKTVSGGAASAAEKALEFYTSFARSANPKYSWSKDFSAGADDLFASNKVGMMLGYSGMKARLFSKSPYLKFGVAPVPQMKNAVFNKNFAEYWGYGVYKNSKNKDAAWQFLKFLTRPENERYYLAVTGRPAAQRELIVAQQQDEGTKVFADQALTATTFTQIDHEGVRSAFREMIEAQISSDQSLKQTLQNAELKINATVKKL